MQFFKWFLVLLLGFSVFSAIAGVVEGAVLGPYADQAVWAVFTETYAVESSSSYGKFSTLFIDPRVYSTMWQALTWNYAMLNDGVGFWIKVVFLWPTSFGMGFCLALTILSHIPVIGRGG